ncbi:MAG: ABC transporter ATP-binding protein [Armatimonadota bacterium]|nr:ABC transporter ATP-binding protein [Armatimonadota bacterium]
MSAAVQQGLRPGEVVLEARGIVKRFPGVVALDHVDLDIRAGEVHAVLGQNGAGKTTLMNILFGLLRPDEGEIYVAGRKAHFRSPHDALAAGIGMVHQTRRLVAAHTVLENIVLGGRWGRGFLDLRRARGEVEALCRCYGFTVDLGARVWQLSEGEKQWVEIVRAAYGGARILILDEPTSVLTPPEVEALLAALGSLVRTQRVTVVLVTHKLPIVMALSDRVTVLRSGRVAARLATADTTERMLVYHMIGEDISAQTIQTVARPAVSGRPVLRVEGLGARNDKNLPALRDIAFSVGEGEILGVAGVTGNGQEELAQVLAGLRPALSGRVLFGDRDVTRCSPLERWRLGMGYVPADRSAVASIAAFSLVENTAMNYHFDPNFTRRGLLDYSGLEGLTRGILSTYRVKAPRASVSARVLSGGNLQRLILGRVLSRRPRLLIAHLPTQGLDVEAAAFVRRKLIEARAEGTAILLISEDLDEILSLCDRVAPMYEGRFMALLPREEADAQTVGAMMAGLRPARVVAS